MIFLFIEYRNGANLYFMMAHEVILFNLKQSDISISIVLGFEGDDLMLSGYDRGERVEMSRGDWDYEYSIRVKRDQLPALYLYFKVVPDDASSLVVAISQQFHGNYAYSDFMKYLNEQGILYEAFSW